MTARLIQDNYGKSRVRLIKVDRSTQHHQIQNLTINIALEGDFDDIHIKGDNSACLPTDTMKNTVYALAGQTDGIEEVETFGQRLASHFLANCPQVRQVRLEIFEHGWKRMKFDGSEHDHSFVQGSGEKRFTHIRATRENVEIESGVEDLVVMKTTRSGFVGFIKDKYTTLPETTDRILSTAIKASWRYRDPNAATDDTFRAIRTEILQTFAGHESLSVQHTLYAMGERVLEK